MSLETPQFEAQALEIDRQSIELQKKQRLVSKYESVIRNIITTSNIGSLEAGEADGVKWKQVFRSGKQQPVSIVSFSLPEGVTLELVFRPTRCDFKSIFSKYPSVRKYFPHLYLSQTIPYDQQTTQDVLVIDRINGYEEKINGAEFIRHISSSENLDQLCAEVFEMVDEIYHEPLVLSDISPTRGHNVFYNTDTQKFQLFDVDTLDPSDLSHERKFMEFINPGQRVTDEKEIAYIMKMIQMYRKKYPNHSLSYETEEYFLGQYITVSEPSENEDGLIRQNDPNYESAYITIDWRGTRGQTNLPPIKLHIRKGKNIFSIRRDLIEAITENNTEEVKRIFEQCGASIIEERFIETEK